MGRFYLPRWQMWFEAVGAALAAKAAFDQGAFDAKVQVWEEAWTRQSDEFTTEPAGDAVAISARLLAEFFPLPPSPGAGVSVSAGVSER